MVVVDVGGYISASMSENVLRVRMSDSTQFDSSSHTCILTQTLCLPSRSCSQSQIDASTMQIKVRGWERGKAR